MAQTVSQVAEMHGIDIGPTAVGGVISRVNSEVWTEDLFGDVSARVAPPRAARPHTVAPAFEAETARAGHRHFSRYAVGL